MKNKVIFHIDMNAFFANVEKLKNPKLKNKPIVIARDNKKAVVITSTYDLRKLGIKAGKPVFKIKHLCPKDTIFIDPDYYSYSEYSIKLFNFIYHNFTKNIEINSVDECYIDATDIFSKHSGIENLAKVIISKIQKHLNLPCSIGVSFSKFYAKLANNLAKREDYYIISPKNFQKLHWIRPIKQFHNVGDSTTKKLNELGVETGLDYILNYGKFEKNILKSKNFQKLYKNLKGEGSRELDYDHNYIKSLGREQTLITPLSSLFEIKKKLIVLIKNNVLRAKKMNILAKTFVLKIFYKNDPQKNSYSFSISDFIMDEKEIIDLYVKKLIKKYKNKKVQLIGCYFRNIVNKFDVAKQLSIFDLKLHNSNNNLLLIIENINYSFKKEVIYSLEKWEENQNYLFQNRF